MRHTYPDEVDSWPARAYSAVKDFPARTSTRFEKGEPGQIAVKVIDDRGNELLVVKSLSEARDQ